MERVVVLGCSGTGKSTFARRLGAVSGLPVHHLDPLYYGPNWSPGDPRTFGRAIEAVAAGDRWIIEGCFIDHAAEARLARADLVIWLDQPVWLRSLRALLRCLPGPPRPDLPAGCRDTPSLTMFADIMGFDRASRPAIEAALSRLAPDKPVVRLRGDRAIAAWLATARPGANHLP